MAAIISPQLPTDVAAPYDAAAEAFKALLAQLGGQLSGAQGDMAAASGAYQNALNSPAPTIAPPDTGPLAGLAGLAANNMANVLMRQPGAPNEFKQGLQQQQSVNYNNLVQKRIDRLNSLHDTYMEASRRYASLNDFANKMKYEEQAKTALDKAHALADAAQNNVNNAAALQRTNIEAGAHIRAAQIAADRPTTEKDFDPKTGEMLRPFYVSELNKLQMAASRTRDPQQREAAITALRNHAVNKIAGETVKSMTTRLARMNEPFDTSVPNPNSFMKLGHMNVRKPLFTDQEIADIVANSF